MNHQFYLKAEMKNNILMVKTMKLNYQEDNNVEMKRLQQEKQKLNSGLNSSNNLLAGSLTKSNSFKVSFVIQKL